MQACFLRLVDFRSYASTEVTFAPELTAVMGANGEGKTNLIEAIGYVAGVGSLRGAPDAALIRWGCARALIRCEVRLDDSREVLIEAEIAQGRPNRLLLNGQRASRRELLGAVAVTVFSPDDLGLVKGGSAGRRGWLDDALVAVRPSCAALRSDLARILRQRNTLLRQAVGRVTEDVATTLDVWDAKLAQVGDELRQRRSSLLAALRIRLAADYARVAGTNVAVDATYVSSWGDESLVEALASARQDDLRRGGSTVGPHRDDVALWIGGLPARSHASQGEQRSLALAMRLAVDDVVRQQRGVRPILLLDDVFSELDQRRAAALLEALPGSQRILTTASELPVGVSPQGTVTIIGGVPTVEMR